MTIFSAAASYDRTQILASASKACAQRRLRKATALYRRVLAAEPSNLELHAKLAPLLAARGFEFDAWMSFATCARAALRAGQPERAAAVYREAVRCLPRRIEAWQKLAGLERKQGRADSALEVLLEARQQFRGRRWRAEAIALLRRARQIDPQSLTVSLDLCRLLAQSDQESEAQLLLDEQARSATGSAQRQIRWAQWRISPTLVATWLLLQALFAHGSEASEDLAEELPTPRRIAA
jgi:tetratricopeptide (TPR) repeat protein